jgi:hypothetical protein
MFDNKIWILKPIRGYKGKGIYIFKNYDEYIYFFKNTKDSWYEYVLSEYIINPLLIQKRKFHIRSYCLMINGLAYMSKNPEIITAKQNYLQNDYTNKDIHDTHESGSILGLCIVPDLVNAYGPMNVNSIYVKIKEIIKYITKLKFMNDVCYDETEQCFEVYGFDFMIDDNFNLFLLEVNDKIGLPYGQTNLRTYFMGILQIAVDPIYKPENIPELSDYFMVV